MKNINKIFSFFFFVTMAFFFLGYSSGQAGNYAGAPLSGGGNESYCTDCHSSFALEPTNLVLTGTPTNYTAGQTYPLTLTVTDNNMGIVQAGFQIVATNGSSGTQIGTFSTPTGTQLAGSGRLIQQYPQALNSARSASWSFDWTAPSSGSPANVVFYYVAVAGNNGGGSGGDYVHSGSSNLIALGVELLAFNAVVTTQPVGHGF